MCRVLGVSTSGYYAWRDRAPSATAMNNAVLVARIRQVHADCHHTCGMPTVRAELREQGLMVSRKRIAQLMRTHGICGISRRRGCPVIRRWGGRMLRSHHHRIPSASRNFLTGAMPSMTPPASLWRTTG